MSHPADAWMPWYGDDFLESERVSELEPLAQWLYLRLLWRQWKHGSLPRDPRNLLPGFADRWDALWAQVAPFFDVGEDGRLRNARCTYERGLAEKRVESSGEKARHAAAKRWSKHKQSPKQCLEHSSKQSSEQCLGVVQAMHLTGPDRTIPDTTRPDSLFPPPAASPEATDKPKPRKRKAKADAEPPHPDHQPLIRYWTDAYAKAYGTKYPFDSRDAAHVHRLLKLASAQEIREAFDAALADPWWHDHGLTLKALLDQFGRFRALATKPQRQGETTAIRRMRSQLEEAQDGAALAPGFNALEGLSSAGQKRLTR